MKHNKVIQPISFTNEDVGKTAPSKESSYRTSAESIIFGSYVTKNRLQSIVYETFSNTSIAYATEVNIFIDLYSVLHQIFSKGYRTDISNTTVITSAIINMCGHYRSFFKTLGVKSTFFLVYSTNTCEINEKLVYGYNKSFKEKSQIKLFKDITDINFEILSVLCPYLEDIHFIRNTKGFEVAVIIADLIEKINDGNPNLIISKDLYPLQLCYKYPFTSYLYPIKKYDPKNHTANDVSIMVPLSEKDTYPIAFWNLLAERRKIDPSVLYDINPSNFILLESLHYFPERGMLPLAGNISSCVKIIRKLGGNQIQIQPEQLKYDDEINSTIPVSIAISRYNALDVSFALPYYQADIESKSIKLQNLDDNGTVNRINSTYFEANPINILNL